MFFFIKKFYRKYFVREEYSHYETLNIAIFGTIFFGFAFTLIPELQEFTLVHSLTKLAYITSLISFILNYKRFYLTAKVFFIFTTIINFSFTCLLLGKDSLIHLYYITFIGLASLIFTKKESLYKYSAVSFSVLLFLFQFFNQTVYFGIEPISKDLQQIMSSNNLLGFVFCIVFYYFTNEILNRNSQKKIDTNNANLRSIFDADENGVVLIDKNLEILNLNTKFNSIFKNIFKSNLTLKTILIKFLKIDYLLDFQKCIGLAFQGEKSNLILENLDLQSSALKIYFSPIFDSDDNISSVIISGQDITEFKKIQNDIQRYVKNFEILFESANLMIWLFDANGIIRNVNSFALEYSGIDSAKENIIGRTVLEIMSNENGKRIHEEILQILKTGESVLNSIEYADDVNCIASDKIVNFDGEGKILGLSIFSRDITASEISEKRLRLLTSVVLNTKDGILITEAFPIDETGPKIIYINESFTKVTGFTMEDVYGKTPRIFQGPRTDKEILAKIKQAMLNFEPVQVEIINYTKSGEEYWVDLTIVPSKDTDGNYSHFISSQRDITERKRSEMEILRAKNSAEVANKYKSQFLANMSHEIRTPLNSILGFTEALLNEEKNEERKSNLNYIFNSGESLLNLLNDILDISKIEEGKLLISPIEFNLTELINSIYLPYKMRANEKSIEFLLEIDPSLPSFFFQDSHRIRQVLINLIGNSMKFTDNGKIQFKVKLVKIENGLADVLFIISDTGIGIKKENQELIYDSFVQEDDSTTRKFGGTGLGLSICKNLVNLMNGSIGLESPSLELGSDSIIGTDFYFTLPLRIVENNQAEKIRTVKKNYWFEKKLKLLVVEDNETNQILINKVLTKMNCDVSIARNGKIAIDFFKENSYDAILMDIQMPVMDGYEATRAIRRIKEKKQIPIIAISANVYKNEIDLSKDVGMDGYLTKPFKQIEIFEALERLIFREKL